jgi:dTDP-4-dehydrorhamnose reductase
MTVLVLGSSGQLASHLRNFLPDANYCGRDKIDLSNPVGLSEKIHAMKPTAIVNAAGYTAVDKAESEPTLAWRINAESVAERAGAAATLDIPFVHVSTDYVFDGRKTTEYDELDAPNPISTYGATKLAGELAARSLSRRTWILRASWVFSEYGSNFVKTMLRLAATCDSLSVVADQRGRPTYAGDLASVIARLVERSDFEKSLPFGTYNACGGAIVSWHEFAEKILDHAFRTGMIAQRVPMRAISTSDYPTAAKRPPNSALKPNRELETAVEFAIDWEPSLGHVLAKLRG